FDFDAATTAGVLAGGLTSAPAFAAASAETSDPTRLSVAFALAYPLGVLGLIIMIAVLPRLTRTDLSRGAVSEDEVGDDGVTRILRKQAPELTRAFEVLREEITGRALKDLRLSNRTGCFITRIHRGDEI